MNTLKIINHIKEFGLDETINRFSLKVRKYPHKFILKYNQIESPLGLPQVRECRGLVLSNDLRILSYPFYKFFNIEEGNADIIDWNTAKVLKKEDGSLIQVYYDFTLNEWCVGTSGTAEGETDVNGDISLTFKRLFEQTLLNYHSNVEYFYNRLIKGYTYLFELCTPYNIVVTPHETSKLVLLGVRDLTTLEEINYEMLKTFSFHIEIPLVEFYNINSEKDIRDTFVNMPFSEEGYVVVDNNFNRVKIKNPSYVAVHHLKDSSAQHNIMEVIKNNEIDEYTSIFKERKDEVLKLNYLYLMFQIKLQDCLNTLIPYITERSKETDKIYAEQVFTRSKEYNLTKFSGFFFAYKNNKVNSVIDYVRSLDNKLLYTTLNELNI